MVASIFVVRCWETRGSHQCFWLMARWMATRNLGGIFQFSDGWERHFCPRLSRNLQEYPKLPKTTHQEQRTFQKRERKCTTSSPPPTKGSTILYSFLAKFVIWSGGKHSFFGDNVDIFHIYTKWAMMNHTEMQLKFQDSWNPSVFITAPKVGGTGLNLQLQNHAAMTETFWYE